MDSGARDGGSDRKRHQRRWRAGATGPSGTHCRAPQFQRHLAGAEHGVLESGESFGGSAERRSGSSARSPRSPPGRSVVRGGTIPYRPEALAKRNENRAKWPAADPEAKCYMLGVPRVTYHNMPFQIFQGDGDLLMVYPVRRREPGHLHEGSLGAAGRFLDGQVERARGTATCWWSPRSGRTASRGWIGPAIIRQQPVDGHRALHAAGAESHLATRPRSTIRRRTRARGRSRCRCTG